MPRKQKEHSTGALRPYVEGEANAQAPGFVTQHYLGKMGQQCPHCDALMFKCESTAKEHGHQLFGLCCGKGKVHLEHIQRLPERSGTCWMERMSLRMQSSSASICNNSTTPLHLCLHLANCLSLGVKAHRWFSCKGA